VGDPHLLAAQHVVAAGLELTRVRPHRGGVAVARVDARRGPRADRVTGEVAVSALLSNRTGAAGQALVLTKALGTGFVAQASGDVDERRQVDEAAAAGAPAAVGAGRNVAAIGSPL